MRFLDENSLASLRKKLEKMKNPVKIILFVSEKDENSGNTIEEFLNEVKQASEKIELEKIIVERNGEKANEYSVYGVPSFTIHGKEKRQVNYYGLPLGQEFGTFIWDILDVSKEKPDISDDLLKKISDVQKDVLIQVFVSSTCPHCPQAAKVAHDLAIINPRIKADVIDTSQFKPLAMKYNIRSVPTTVINSEVALEGIYPIDVLLHTISKTSSAETSLNKFPDQKKDN